MAIFKHLDLREIEGWLDPLNAPSTASGKMYWHTRRGQADVALRAVAFALKNRWTADAALKLRIEDVEAEFKTLRVAEQEPLIPAALKRLRDMGQVKLDFDRDGVLISPGSTWIET